MMNEDDKYLFTDEQIAKLQELWEMRALKKAFAFLFPEKPWTRLQMIEYLYRRRLITTEKYESLIILK